MLARAEGRLAADEDDAEERLSSAFSRFEREQPALSERVGVALSRCRDEVAQALGYFLSLALWLAFDEEFAGRVGRLTKLEVRGVEESLALDEQLRGADPVEAVDSDDVVAMEQPHALAFLHEHVEAALEVHADVIDVDEIHDVYRALLVELLALSYAVRAPDGEELASSSQIYA
jgi:hypothetical protein